MRILVIGGTRFIGAHLVRRLHETGAAITVFHRGVSSASPVLPPVRHVTSPAAAYPIRHFPAALAGSWDLAIHMVAMGRADAEAATGFFAGRAGRLVVVSSCDVYRAYGRLTGTEPGAPDPVPLPVPLDEDAPLRTALYPYRGMEAQLGAYAHDYDKILVEAAVRSARAPDWTILRLPKVYGPEDNADLASIYGFAKAPGWRWTHGHVTNVAAAIAAASLHPAGRCAIFNVGEATTPTMGERLARLPPAEAPPPDPPPFDFRQDLVLDTGRLRRRLGYADTVDEPAAMATLALKRRAAAAPR